MVLTFVVPLLVLVAFLVAERVRGRIALGRYKRVLLAQGVKLSPQDFTSGPITGENGAPEVALAYKELQSGTVLPNHYPPVMRLTPAGRAVVGFREAQWRDEETTNCWEDLAAELATNAPTLARIRAALEKPVLDNQLDFSKGSRMSFTHLTAPKTLTRWFGARSQLALHEGQPQEALQDLLPCLQLPRLLARDHLAISELVRIAVAAIGRTHTWEALQADGWTEADLSRLQQAWQDHAFAEPMVHALEGEVVFAEACYEAMRHSNAEAAAVLFGMEEFLPVKGWERLLRQVPGGGAVAEFGKKQLYCRVWRFAWLDQDEQHYLEQMQRLLAIARTGASTRSFLGIQPAIIRLEEETATRGVYDQLRHPTESFMSLSRVMSRAMRAETDRSLTVCAIALKRYALVQGHLPSALGLLVPQCLSSVPIDYMDGQPLKYQLNPDGTFALYSVGEDGKDDGGDASLPPEKALQNLWARKDVVWPASALPKEVEAYRSAARPN